MRVWTDSSVQPKEKVAACAGLELENEGMIGRVVVVFRYANNSASPRSSSNGTGVEDMSVFGAVPAMYIRKRRVCVNKLLESAAK